MAFSPSVHLRTCNYAINPWNNYRPHYRIFNLSKRTIFPALEVGLTHEVRCSISPDQQGRPSVQLQIFHKDKGWGNGIRLSTKAWRALQSIAPAISQKVDELERESRVQINPNTDGQSR